MEWTYINTNKKYHQYIKKCYKYNVKSQLEASRSLCQSSGRSPSKNHFMYGREQWAQQFLTKRYLSKFSIGFHLKWSWSMTAILVSLPMGLPNIIHNWGPIRIISPNFCSCWLSSLKNDDFKWIFHGVRY